MNNYAVWLTEYSDPNLVWAADERIVLADIRSECSITEKEAKILLMVATIDSPLKLRSYEVWIEMTAN